MKIRTTLAALAATSLLALATPASAAVMFFSETFQNSASIGSGVTLNTTVNPTGTATPGYVSVTSLTNSISAYAGRLVQSGGTLSGLGTLEFMLFFQPDPGQSSQLRVTVQLNQSINPNDDGVVYPQLLFKPSTGAVFVNGVAQTGSSSGISLPANEWAKVILDLSAISPTDFDPTYDRINSLTLQGNGQSGTFFVDNIVAIPEPGTMAMGAVVGLGLLCRRRRS